MSKKADGGNFRRCNLVNACGFGGLPSENDSDSHKVLSHSNRGLRSRHVPEGEYTDLERVQGDLL